jgi:hypothetical protein
MNSRKPVLKKPTDNRRKVNDSENEKPINPGRHEYQCTICSHAQRDEVERAFLNWTSLSLMGKQYSVSRDSIYRHAHALGLMDKRRRNVRAALEKIIEKAGDVEVSATAVVSAVAAYAKINANGQWIERSEHISLNELFDRMTPQEMEIYAKEGTVPTWFERTLGATPTNSQGASNVQ